MEEGELMSCAVLELIKTAQAQHGLRHKDYKRYRQYCTNRLRRLYKSLKFTHGRGRFVKKSLGVSTVTEVRYLHIALYSAERAWSQAMEMRESLQGAGGKQRYHLLRRLRKACKWADLLESLCNEKADSKTALEATAYASYLRGTLLIEIGDNWQFALRKFKNARIIYEELGKYGDVDNHILCKQRVEELEPNIRHCLLKMDENNTGSMEEEPEVDLHNKLEAIMAEARTQQEISTATVTWLGHKFPVHNTKTRACILKVQDFEKDLSGSSMTPEKKLGIYDKILAGYQEARRNIREDLVTAGNAEDMKDNLIGLDKAVSCLIFARTIERAELQITLAKDRLSKQQADAGSLAIVEELVSLCDTLNTNISELSDLATSGKGKSGAEESYAVELSVKQLLFRAERCFYLAHSYSIADKHAEAFALFNRAREHAQLALNLTTANQRLGSEIKELLTRCKAQSALVHANGIMRSIETEEKVQNGVASLSLADHKDNYLLDQLEKYISALGAPGTKEAPRISQVPPAFRPIPCRPIFLDTAINAIDFPSLEARLKEKKKGLFGRWW